MNGAILGPGCGYDGIEVLVGGSGGADLEGTVHYLCLWGCSLWLARQLDDLVEAGHVRKTCKLASQVGRCRFKLSLASVVQV